MKNTISVKNLEKTNSDYVGTWHKDEVESDMAEIMPGRAVGDGEWIEWIFDHVFSCEDRELVQCVVDYPEIESVSVRTSQGLVRISLS